MTAVLERLPAFFWWLAAPCVVAALAEIAIVFVSRARLARQERLRVLAVADDWQSLSSLRAPSRWLEIVAALIPLIVALLFVALIQSARLTLNQVLGMEADRSQSAGPASTAISQETNATPMALWGVGATSFIGSAAAGMAISARLRARGLLRAASLAVRGDAAASAWLRFPGPNTVALVASIEAFLVLGFAPIWKSTMEAVLLRTGAFAAATAPDAKGQIVNRALDQALETIDPSLIGSRGGIGIAAVLAGVLAWRFSSARARGRDAAGAAGHCAVKGANLDLALACVTTTLAIVAFMMARPLRDENRLPWPPYEGGERLMALVPTPDLEGPDVMVRAPVLHVTPDRSGLDGAERNATAIAGALTSLRQNFELLRPDHPFDGVDLVLCQPETPIDRVAAVLRASLAGGFPHPMFVFLRRQVTDRPLIGRLWRNRARAAQASVVEARAAANPAATMVAVEKFPTCAALSGEIVAARRAGREVALLLPVAPEEPGRRRSVRKVH